jgi:hypothetical protein
VRPLNSESAIEGFLARETEISSPLQYASLCVSFRLKKPTTRTHDYRMHIKTRATCGILKRERCGSRNVRLTISDSQFNRCYFFFFLPPYDNNDNYPAAAPIANAAPIAHSTSSGMILIPIISISGSTSGSVITIVGTANSPGLHRRLCPRPHLRRDRYRRPRRDSRPRRRRRLNYRHWRPTTQTAAVVIASASKLPTTARDSRRRTESACLGVPSRDCLRLTFAVFFCSS